MESEKISSQEKNISFIKLYKILNNKFKKNKNILDVGAGSGQLKKMLNKNFKFWVLIFIKKFKDVVYDDINVFNKSFSISVIFV